MNKKEIFEYCITHYENFEEYEKNNNFDKEEFQDYIERGFIQYLTLGLYNGYTNSFLPREINASHVYDSIIEYLKETDYSSLSHPTDCILENMSECELVTEFCNSRDVFTLENEIYVNLD